MKRCPEQGCPGYVSKSWKTKHVPVRLDDEHTIIVMPEVPVWTCDGCHEAYTDYEAEEICDRVVSAVVRAYTLGRASK